MTTWEEFLVGALMGVGDCVVIASAVITLICVIYFYFD